MMGKAICNIECLCLGHGNSGFVWAGYSVLPAHTSVNQPPDSQNMYLSTHQYPLFIFPAGVRGISVSPPFIPILHISFSSLFYLFSKLVRCAIHAGGGLGPDPTSSCSLKSINLSFHSHKSDWCMREGRRLAWLELGDNRASSPIVWPDLPG